MGRGGETARPGAVGSGPADVVLPDGTAVWCDGGPRTAGLALDAPVVHRFALESSSLRPDAAAPESAAASWLAPDQRGGGAARGRPGPDPGAGRFGQDDGARARFRHLVVERSYGAASVGAGTTGGPGPRCRNGWATCRAMRSARSARSIRSVTTSCRRARPNVRVIDEREIRNRIEPHVTLKFRANTDALRPYLEALEEVQLGLRSPELVEMQRGDVEGFAEMFYKYRDGSVGRRDRLRRADRGRGGDAAAGARGAAIVAARVPPPAGRRVPGSAAPDLLLVRLVAAPAYDVFGVGDDDQVIYGYSGADPAFLIDFARYFPGVGDHPLEVNYRCPPPVVDGRGCCWRTTAVGSAR